MSLQIDFGIAIQQLRKSRGLSQERLALEADIDRRYMSDVENGKRNISLDIMERIASHLGIEVSEVMHHAENVSKTPLTIEALKEWLCDGNHEDTIVLESPDYLSAIIGITEDGRLIYSYEKMVEHLMHEDSMDAEEAMEFIDYNTIRALPYAGDKAPIVMYDVELSTIT